MELPKAVDVKELVPEIDVTDLVGIADIRKGKLPAYKRPVKMLAVDEDKRYYDRPVPNYDERVGFALPGCFANNLLLREKEREYLGASKFKDQIVVDLGAGMHPDGYLLALASQAKGYVGVEAFYADYLIERLTRKVPKIEDKEMADSSLAYYLEKDELEALNWLKDNTNSEEVVLSAYGIGNYIPRISFGIPSKNEGGAIRETILRIADVDYPKEKFEIIVINDGSDDNTLEEMVAAQRLARKKNVDVKVVDWKQNKGKREGMAECIKRSRGEIIIFIDSDSFVDIAKEYQNIFKSL